LTAGDVYVNTIPLFHVGGQGVTFQIVQALATNVLVTQFDPGLHLELLERERATHTIGVQTMLVEVIDHPDVARCDLSALRSLSTGGAAVARRVIRHIERALDVRSTIVFAQTEACGFVSQTLLDDGPEESSLVSDDLCCVFRDGNRREVGRGANDCGHDRGVHDAQSLDAVHAEMLVDDIARARPHTHAAGPDRVVPRRNEVAGVPLEHDVVVEVSVVEHRARTDEVSHCRRTSQVVASPQCLDQTFEIGTLIEQVEVDEWASPRVLCCEDDPAAATWLMHAAREHDHHGSTDDGLKVGRAGQIPEVHHAEQQVVRDLPCAGGAPSTELELRCTEIGRVSAGVEKVKQPGMIGEIRADSWIVHDTADAQACELV
jgi:acyl-CoA synthetase (AMP-forming)/AMP-acid ligase II